MSFSQMWTFTWFLTPKMHIALEQFLYAWISHQAFYVRRKLTSLKEIKVQNQETSGGIEEDHEIAC